MYNKGLEYLLKNDPTKVMSNKGIKIRKCFHPIFHNVIVPLSSKNNLIIERQATVPQGKPIIFACTHGFRDDVAFSLKTAGVHSYLLYASIPDFYESFDGPALWTNGVIMLDRKDKESRKAAKEKMKYALSLGTNVLMYPEGVWNKTENLVVQKLYPGIYDVAKESGAIVMPLATIQVENTVYSILDEAFDICQYERQEGLNILRDKMATAKYELMEKYAQGNRNDIGDASAYWDDFLDKLVATANGLYDYEIEDTAQYIDKTITEPDEAFAHLQMLQPNRNNAFLLRSTS